MDPQQEFAQWLKVRQSRPTTPDDPNWTAWLNGPGGDPKYFAGESLSPAAKALFKQKDPATGKEMALNPETGKYDIEAKGAFSHWETWVQLGLGAALGAAVAIPAMTGGAAASGAGTASGAGGLGTAAGTAGAGAGGAGWLKTAGTIAGLGGEALSAIEQGRAQGRVAQTGINQSQDRLQQQRYQNELDAAKLNLSAPGQRAKTSVQGDILANAQPFKFTGGTHMAGNIPVPDSTGGLNPGIFSANTRALGGQLSSNALADNTSMGGKAIGAPPEISPTDNATGLDSILNTASIVGGLGSAFGDALGRYRPKTKATDQPPDPWSVM